MKLINQTDVLSTRFGDADAVRILCNCGFDAVDYSMFAMSEDDSLLNTPAYKKHVRTLRAIAESYGKSFAQAHAPFPCARDGDDDYNEKMFPRVVRALEITGMLDAKICVVHPVVFKKYQMERNLEFYGMLEPYAKKFGVKIALENMWGWKEGPGGGRIVPNVCSVAQEFNAYIDALDPKYFTACLDLGHCGLVGEDAADMIRAMGRDRIGCLHVHDNDFIHDSHTIPFTMNMEWDRILRALGEIDYQGQFTFEADNFLRGFPNDLIPACETFMERIGRAMIKRIERCRKPV
ncbi:MAG: sugar phosphate isomerase/epimerase [Clostridia bacterium]|nr:sugar phosphate isomerase/epimerase [Clostridia bacterium]